LNSPRIAFQGGISGNGTEREDVELYRRDARFADSDRNRISRVEGSERTLRLDIGAGMKAVRYMTSAEMSGSAA
jgi:hypothetical protein